MLALVVRRLAILVPTVLLLSFGVFCLSLTLDPERAAQARAGGENLNLEAFDAAKSELRLDEPIVARYVHWLGRVAQGDLGRSFAKLESVQTADGSEVQGQPVVEAIGEPLPRTLSLVGVAVFFTLLIGIPVGIVGGVRPGSLADRVTVLFATVGLAIPNFWIGMLLVSWLAISSDLLPAVGYVPLSEGWWDWLQHLLIPGFALSLGPAAIVARQMRSALIEVMGQPYIRTAWAKGASVARVVFRHALRNAASAPLTVFGMTLVSLLSGTVIIETLFGINGLGRLVLTAVLSSDVPVLQGIVLLFIVLNVSMNLLIDIAYGFLNPKVRVS